MRYETPARAAALFITVFLANSGCDWGAKPEPRVDTGLQTTSSDEGDEIGDYELAEFDTSACDPERVPAARSRHQMAYFFVDQPLYLSHDSGSVSIQRGFVMTGGVTTSGEVLSDLWLFDLTNRETLDGCPWVLLSEDAGVSVYDGAMVYDSADEDFALIGGYEDDGPDTYASDAVYTLSLEDLWWDPHFSYAYSLGALDYTLTRHAAVGTLSGEYIGCSSSSVAVSCFDEGLMAGGVCHELDTTYVNRCTNTLAGFDEAFGCNDFAGEEDGVVGPYFGCVEDPMCTDDAEVALETVSVAGLAGHAAVYDPLGDRIYVHGGTTGCVGQDCSQWYGLYELGEASTFTLSAANNEHVLELSDSGASVVASDTSDLARSAWPAGSSHGVRGLAAAAVGIDWSNEARGWQSAGGSRSRWWADRAARTWRPPTSTGSRAPTRTGSASARPGRASGRRWTRSTRACSTAW